MATLAVCSWLAKEDTSGRKKVSEGTLNDLILAGKGLSLVSGQAADALHHSGHQDGCSFPAVAHRELRELKLPCFRKNMTVHVDQLPSCQNKINGQQMKWSDLHTIMYGPKEKPGNGPPRAQACSLLQHLCFISSIFHLFLVLVLSCSHCDYPQLSLPPLKKTSRDFMSYVLW